MRFFIMIALVFFLTGCGSENVTTTSNAPSSQPVVDLPIVERPAGANEVFGRIDVQTDPVTRVTWYRHKNCDADPDYQGHSFLEFYFGKMPSGVLTPRIRIFWTGGDYVYADTILIRCGDKLLQKRDLYFLFDRQGGYMVHETYDSIADEDDLRMVEAISTTDGAILRVQGQTSADHEFTDHDRVVLQDMLLAYRQMGGQLP